jgi:hypothetical protein
MLKRRIFGRHILTLDLGPVKLRSDCSHSSLHAFGRQYQQGIMMDFTALAPAVRCLPDLLPITGIMQPRTGMKVVSTKTGGFESMDIMPSSGTTESTSLDSCWRVVLSLDDKSKRGDHKVQQNGVFPFAGCVAMAGNAIRQITGIEAGYSLRHVVAHTTIVYRSRRFKACRNWSQRCGVTNSQTQLVGDLMTL